MLTIRNRVLAVAVMLVLAFVMVAGAAAQEGETFGLSDEDFLLWTSANEASTQFDSLSFTFEATMDVDVEGTAVGATLVGSGAITADAFQMSVAGNIDGVGAVDIELRAVGNSAYINGIDGTDAWYEIDEATFAEIQDAAGSQLPIDPGALAEGDLSSTGLSDEQQMEVFGDVFALIGALPSYIEITRDADEEGEAVFFIEFLLSEFVQDDALESIVAVGIASDGATSMEDAQAQASEGLGMATMVTAGSEISFTQFVDPASNLVQAGFLVLSLGGEGMPFLADVTLDVVLEEYDPVITIEAPAESTPIDQLPALAGGF